MFSCLKSRGFNLEDTHITNSTKLSRLFGIVAIAFCWAYSTGDNIDQNNEIDRKSHGRRVRSIFKTGFVYLRNLLAAAWDNSVEYVNVLAFIFEKDKSVTHSINWGFI